MQNLNQIWVNMWWAKLDFKVDVDAMVKQLEVAKAMYDAIYDDHGYVVLSK